MSKASLELGGGNWAAKDGKLLGYAVGDTSGKYLPREFTFSRGADIAATRVNKDGLIEKYRENLLLQSNNFGTTWAISNASLTSGHAGYDGSSDAWQCEASGLATVLQSVSTSGVQTFSVYAKAGTENGIFLRADGVNNPRCFFNLDSGTLGSILGGVIDANIEDVGNGWHRCSITYSDTTNDARIYVANNSNGFPSSGNIYIQDAQLEQGLVATDYLESGATTGKAGVLEDLPRIDYTGGSASLLLEPERANDVENSEYHSGSTYANNNVSTTDNQAISPEGVQNAAKIVLDSGTNTSNGGHYFQFGSTAGTDYTISVFAKAGEYRYFTFTYGSYSAGGGHFDLQEGTLLGTITNANYSNVVASIEDYGNGWYRLVVSLTDNSSVSGRFLSMKPSPDASVPSNNNYSSTGDGTSGAYIYGFQLEEGSYPTSYIPTYGVSATRNGDDITYNGMQSKGIFGANAGTIFLDIKRAASYDNTEIVWNFRDSSDNDMLMLYYEREGECDVFRLRNQLDTEFTTDSFTLSFSPKIAIVWDGTSRLEIFGNGSKITKTGGNFSSDVSIDDMVRQRLDRNTTEFSQILFFPTALTDSECIALTTL